MAPLQRVVHTRAESARYLGAGGGGLSSRRRTNPTRSDRHEFVPAERVRLDRMAASMDREMHAGVDS